ncbi:xanthine dehydrogenase family protein molybdopterin-binding subunit [Dictyobacter aurantiacus]|uniref:Aldehyde dehydrogenase n=1 Tax=Dictyobacter aurantiacus TaxID=1936993 RepID=A0A401ZN29_9CHLR|nr:xanthine dehydrogenase family protein molybdopterin-binding subunit [Dictyobacter aurantiacus]GCE08271.1 aldehyde dehydrogenase [Dictyobacter aurantiacus]
MSERHALPAGLERRTEDYRLITGRGAYVDDVRLPAGRPAPLQMAVVRSPYAHARINSIQLDAARAVPGVAAVYAGDELVEHLPLMEFMFAQMASDLKMPARHPLAVGKVRYVGDPVAVVLAEDIYAALDGRDLVEVDYEPLPSVTDPERALAADAPLLYEELGSNVVLRGGTQGGDVAAAFAQADHTVTLRLENQRLAPASMEPRACLFDFDAQRQRLTAWLSSQSVFQARNTLARFLALPPEHIQVYNADVGGAFGAKTLFLGEEIIAAVLAKQLARPVKWIEDRGENLQAHMHGRGQINYVEAACTAEGRLLALRVRTIGDVGAFLYSIGPLLPLFSANMLSGAYQIPAIECQIASVLTNKVPTGAYRGAGRPEAAYIVERTIERVAHELQLDPVEVRRRNLIPPDAFPYRTAGGLVYDSGNYQAALDKALALADYAGWRERQRQRRAQSSARLLGIGVSTFIETTGGPSRGQGPQEAATVRIQRDGTILVQSAVAHNGQGHFTTFAQIAAEAFGVPGSQVEVRLNDASLPGYSTGTNASRITQISGSAIHLAAQKARTKALQLASQVLEAAVDDLVLEQGRIVVRGVPARAIELGELARRVEEQPDLIEREAPNPANNVPIEGLAAWHDFASAGTAIASGAHIAIVEIDSETGDLEILRYIAVDDAGHVLNHYLTEAQVHGSLAQGIGQALFEGVVYDDEGQNLTGTFMDYAIPTAGHLPSFELDLVETPSPLNPLGAKGVGESGTIGAPPTIVNAALDALAPLGVKSIDMPLTPEKLWAIIRSARQGTLQQPEPQPPAIFRS